MTQAIELEAVNLRAGQYAVKPIGQLGTCGFYPVAWEVQYITARNPADAIRKANPIKGGLKL